MKIAMMVRGYLTAPCPVDMVYAPIDLAIAISKGLVKKGHEVTYFGPNGTVTETPVETLGLRPLVHNGKELEETLTNIEVMGHNVLGLWDGVLVREMFERARKGEYDLLHFHHPDAALPYVHLYPDVPVVYTLHDPIYSWYRELFELYNTPNQFYISISDNQRLPAPDLPYVATVYNGIDMELFSLPEKKEDDYLLFVGRIVPEKGVREAVKIAQETNNRLLIIGPLFGDKQEYFDQYIKPHLNEKILYLGLIEHDKLTRYYMNAKAFLMPIQWEEPFGLTMVEAMACGAPVISLRRGSACEIVADKKSGFLVDTIGEMIDAVKKIDKIKAKDCREHAEKNFSIQQMVDGYEAAYQKVLKAFKVSKTNTLEKLKI